MSPLAQTRLFLGYGQPVVGPISVLECFVPAMIEAGRGGHGVSLVCPGGVRTALVKIEKDRYMVFSSATSASATECSASSRLPRSWRCGR